MEPIKVFIDTNVLVDYFTGRMNDGYARKVMLAGKTDKYRVCISILTAVNAIYVLRKCDVKLTPHDIERICTVLGQRQEQWNTARSFSDMPDFEDAIQTACAIDNRCRIVVSRDKHYQNCPLMVLTPKDFVDMIS